MVTRLALALVVVIPNIVGAGVVLVVAAWVLPLGELVEDDPGALMRNLVAFGAYVLGAVLVGVVWGHFRMRVPRPPGPGADDRAVRRQRKRLRRVVLRGPLRLATVQTVLWAAAVVVFVLINVFASPRLGVSVGVTVALGGVATVAVTYRLVERVLRRDVARVLNDRPPSGRVLPGVALRAVGSWVLGTAVPLVGVLLAAVAALAFGGYTTDRLALVVLVLGGVALVVGFLVTVLTAMSTAAPVLAVRRAQRQVEDGDYDAEVPVFDTTELGLLQAGFNTMVGGLRERERVRDLFGRHVGEDVARTAMENDVELGGEVREVAVLFVDLVGSTRLAATRPPHEVVEILNAFFAVVIDVVEQHDGWINKFEGDAALAVFGAPTALDDAAGCALRAGPGDGAAHRRRARRHLRGHRRLGRRGRRRQHRRHPPLRVHGDRRPGERGRAADRGREGARGLGRGVAGRRCRARATRRERWRGRRVPRAPGPRGRHRPRRAARARASLRVVVRGDRGFRPKGTFARIERRGVPFARTVAGERTGSSCA